MPATTTAQLRAERVAGILQHAVQQVVLRPDPGVPAVRSGPGGDRHRALGQQVDVCEFVVLNELDGDRHLLPYHAVRLRLQLATVYLAIADPATARQLLREIDDILSHRPAAGVH